jgi:hypothetical protein
VIVSLVITIRKSIDNLVSTCIMYSELTQKVHNIMATFKYIFGYQVFSDGKVVGLRDTPIKPFVHRGNGYMCVNIQGDWNGLAKPRCLKQFLLHRLMWEAHNGAIPNDMTVDHIDGNKLNNVLSNFQLLTRGENSTKASAILSEQDVKVVKYLIARGMKGRHIATVFAVSEQTIANIKSGRSWSQIPTPRIH